MAAGSRVRAGRRLRHLVLGLMTAALLAVLGLVAGGARAVDNACVPRWTRVPAPGGRFDWFADIAAIGAEDVWAVGTRGLGDDARVLLAHWDGRRFSVVPSAQTGFLTAVAATSARDVWAVGYTTDTVRESQPLILHWDGEAFTRVPTPMVLGGQLFAVATVAGDDVWAVGDRFGETVNRPLFLHWNGSAWTAQIDQRFDGDLHALTVISRNAVLAAGTSGRRGKAALALRWDGRRWSPLRALSIGKPNELFRPSISGIDGAGMRDIWAVGALAGAAPHVQHWNGARWRLVDVPFAHYKPRYDAREDSWLSDVVELAQTDVWAVGFGIEHWNGRRWQRRRLYHGDGLSAISALSRTQIWAAGSDDGPLVERYRCT